MISLIILLFQLPFQILNFLTQRFNIMPHALEHIRFRIRQFIMFQIHVLFFLKLPDTSSKTGTDGEPARPLREIVMTQRFATGMICGISSYALMTFMMTGAPLAMVVGCLEILSGLR